MDKRLEAAGIKPDLRAIVDVLNQGVVGGARDDKARSVLQAEIEERRQKVPACLPRLVTVAAGSAWSSYHNA